MAKWGGISLAFLGYFVANSEFWVHISDVNMFDYYFPYNFVASFVYLLYTALFVITYNGIKTGEYIIYTYNQKFMICERIITSTLSATANLIVQIMLRNSESSYYKYDYFIYFLIKSGIYVGIIIVITICASLRWCYNHQQNTVSVEEVIYENA